MIVGDMEIRLRADIARLQRDMDDARRVVGNATAGMERAAQAAKAAFSGMLSALGGRELISMTDEYAKFTAQLKLATQSQREYAAAYADVKRIATQSTQGLGETGVLYARIANGTRELGVAQKQVAAITETVNLSLMVSGATASEAASAQLQLSQAFASGTLRGEEFNAVNEAAPRLMLALADGIGVPVGALKKMAEEGQITSGIMADVLPNALAKLREEAKEVQTIAGAFTVLKNNVMEFTGVQAQSSGAVSAITSAVTGLAENLDTVAKVGMTVAAVYGSRMVASLIATANAKMDDIIASRAQARANEEAAAAALRRAQAERQTALIAQSKARETTAMVRAEVAADQQRVASAVTAAEQEIVARQGQLAATAGIIRQEIALEQTRLRAQINGIGRAQRTNELARLAAELAAIEKGMAAQSAALAAQRIAGEKAVADAATAGATRIAAARAAETAATGTVAAATLRARAAQAALTAAMGATAVASRVLTGALALVGGPIGLVTLAITAGITAWTMWGNKAEEANDKALQSTEETTPEMIARLDKQIEKLKERNALAASEPRIKALGEISEADRDGLARAKAALDAVRSGTGEWANQSVTMRQLAEIDILADYETALKRVQQVQDQVAIAANRTRDQRLADWYAQNGSNAQRLAAELEKLKKEFGSIPPEMEKMVRAKYADKGAAAAIKQEATAYQNLITSIRERIAANKLELSGYDKLSESQKATIKLDTEINTGKNKLSADSIKKARAEIEELRVLEASIKSKAQATEFEKNYAEAAGMTARLLADRVKDVEAEATRNEELAATYGMTKSAIEQLELARLEEQLAQRATLGLTLEEIETLEKLIAAKKRNAAAIGAMEQVDAAKKAQEEWKRAAESIEQSLTDALLRGFESGKSFGKNLVDTLKNMFSTLVLRPVIQGVVQSGMSMGASAVGMGNVGGSAIGSAGSMLSSISSAGSIYGAYQSSALGQFMSGMSGSASYASQALGAPMTSAAQAGSATASGLGAGGATPWLGMAGGGLAAYQVGEKYGAVAGGVAGAGTIAAGGALTGALAGTGAMAGATAALAAVPVWGWVAIAALSILGGMQKGPEQNTRLTFGSNNQAGNISINERGNEGKLGQSYIDGYSTGAFGSFGVVSSFWMNAAQPAVQDFIKSVTATDDALAQFMSDTEKAAVKAAVTAQKVVSNSGAEGSDPNGMGGLDKVFSERIKMIFNTLEPGLDSLLAGFKGNSQELGIEATALLQYRTALAQSGETLFGAKVTLQELAALKQPTEAVSAAVARITSQFELTNAVAASLGKTAAEAFGAAGLESVAAREKFVTAAGGFSSLAANAEGFARDFLTDAERNAPVLKMVTEQMQALGFAGVDTRDEFKRVVMGLDLTTDSGVKTYAELMNVAAAFAQVYPVIDQTAIAAKELADAQARANEIADERRGLQERLDAMLMTTDQLREKEIAKLDESNQALLRQIFAIEDSRTALEAQAQALEAQAQAQRDATQAAKDRASSLLSSVDSAFGVLQRVVGREKAALQDRIATEQAIIIKHQALSSSLRSALDSMVAPGQELSDRQSARSQIETALAIAKASGSLPDAESLKRALSVVGQDASALYATQQDYLRDFYTTQNDIASLADLTDSTLSVEEKSLKALEEDGKRLDKILENAQKQIDVLKGIDLTALSIDQGIAALAQSIGAAMRNPIVAGTGAISDAYQSSLGRAPDAEGLQFYQDQLGKGVHQDVIVDAIKNSAEAKLQAIYQATLGRAADADGLQFYMDQVSKGLPLDVIKKAMGESDEAKARVKAIPGFADGGDFGGGLRWVGERGIELEATGPSRIHSTEALMAGLRRPSDSNAALVAEVRALREEVAALRKSNSEENYAIAKNTLNTADHLDAAVNGNVPLATKVIPA